MRAEKRRPVATGAAPETLTTATESSRITSGDKTACDDCGEPFTCENGVPGLVHAAACPIGQGLDAARDTDREWFTGRPVGTVRERALTWAERQQFALLGLAHDDLDRLAVRGVLAAPGVRVFALVPGRWAA
jgi:hypothetical protein